MDFRLFVSLLLIAATTNLVASEIDSFTLRDPEIEDSLFELNSMAQGMLKKALQEANKSRTCDPKEIRKAIKSELGSMTGLFYSGIELAIEKSDRIDARNIELSSSIYRDFAFYEMIGVSIGGLGSLLRVGDFYVGTDKFGHFFDTGHEYFRRVYEDIEPVESALRYGLKTEREYFGFWTTGILSYGDLTANFDGFKFWQRVNGTDLVQGELPYFSCRNGTWRQVSKFDWSDYINAAWDEGQNCNAFRNESLRERVENRIHELERERGDNLMCPIDPYYCEEMIERYGPYSSYIITPLCFEL